MNRFVILKHTVGPELDRIKDASFRESVHFDWMFQHEGALLTWSTQPIDFTRADKTVNATQLADHRLAYLEIEGDIGQGRGTVTQVCQGEYEPLEPVNVDSRIFQAVIRWSANDLEVCREVRIQRSDERLDLDEADGWELRILACR